MTNPAHSRKIEKKKENSEKRENDELKSHLKMARELIDRLHAEVETTKTKLTATNKENENYKSALVVSTKTVLICCEFLAMWNFTLH